jgi:ATP adenylyltransferase
MDMLFSPWRSNYINSFKDKKEDNHCVFCSALSDNEPENSSLIIKRNKHTYTMLNLFPYNSGHLMIIPNRHLSDFTELNAEETTEMMAESSLMIKALTEVMKPQGFNMGMNIGKAAGAGIDAHLHLHIVPRWTGDTNFMPALGEVKIISQDLIDLKNKLVEVLKTLQ